MPNRTTTEVNLGLPATIIKDLGEGEAICPVCGGLGLAIYPNNYGLSKDKETGWTVYLPYRHESVGPCRSCYNGVVNICKHCGEAMPKGHLTCQCEGGRAEWREKETAKELERWEKTQKIPFSEALKRFKYVYIEDGDKYINPNELLEWLVDQHIEAGQHISLKHERIYGTTMVSISLDAGSIIENACDELHDDALDTIDSDAEREMQDFLNGWAERHGKDTKTYYPDYGVGVLLPE